MSWGCDLQTEHERFLTEQHFKKPVFVTDYPKEIKAFYMRLNDDGKTVAAADCLVPGIGEIIGGSQREERLDLLERRIQELGMDPDDLQVLLRPAPLWRLPPRRLRPGLRAHGHVPDRCQQHPRRSAPPQNGWKCGFLRIGKLENTQLPSGGGTSAAAVAAYKRFAKAKPCRKADSLRLRK